MRKLQIEDAPTGSPTPWLESRRSTNPNEAADVGSIPVARSRNAQNSR
jgi:hypothetical protein